MVRAFLTAAFLSAATVVLAGVSSSATAQSTAETAPSSITEIYQDWTVRCNNVASGEGTTQVCAMVQSLRKGQGGDRVLLVTLTPSEDGAVVRFVTPFGIRLSQGLKVNVAGTQVLDAAFNTCMPGGCIVLTELPQASVDVLASGESANVVMIANQNGQPFELTVSLAGFTAAWNRLKDLQG